MELSQRTGRKERRCVVSFEMFPPKRDEDVASMFQVAGELAGLSPDFISVTYGAGGSRSRQTLAVASHIQNELGIPAVAHLTCVGSSREEILKRCQEFEEHRISRVLALRGDRPKEMSDEQFEGRAFSHASELLSFLRAHTGLELFGACYPEKHPEAADWEEELRHMKEKQEAGAALFLTQMFFDNDCFYTFLERVERAGITAPVHAGIMPVTAARQLGTSVSLSGASVPKGLSDLIERYGDRPEELRRAGIDYAIRQISDLAEHGVSGIHLYTMNRPAVAAEIVAALGER